MKVLVVSDWFPYPPIAGAKIRAYNLIRQLARLADVDLVAQVNTLSAKQVAAGTDHLGQFCRSVQSVGAIPYRYSLGKALRTLVDPVPATVRHRRNPALERILSSCLATRHDAVVVTISGFPSSTLFGLVKVGVHPIIADSLELGVMRPGVSTPMPRRLRKRFTWWRLRRFTQQLLRHIDVITVTSEVERTLFADLVRSPDQCIVVPNVLDLNEYGRSYGPRDFNSVLYAGSFGYIANYQAMLWFAREVFPLVQVRNRLKVQVTGSTANRDLSPLRDACPQMEFTGFVDDIKPYFARSGICIVPVLSGGSTRLKIIEAMASGTPVVSTSIGAEGLDVKHEQDILLAERPSQFANSIDRLVNDRALWQRLSAAGRSLVARKYSSDTMYGHLCDVMRRVSAGHVPSSGWTPS